MGLVNIAAFYNPQIIVVGGQLPAMGDVFLAPAVEEVDRLMILEEDHKRMRIEISVLGDRASLYGASLLVFQNLFPESADTVRGPGRSVSENLDYVQNGAIPRIKRGKSVKSLRRMI
jgi:hypothetical protein